jgi:Flp pilus assembly protein TadG
MFSWSSADQEEVRHGPHDARCGKVEVATGARCGERRAFTGPLHRVSTPLVRYRRAQGANERGAALVEFVLLVPLFLILLLGLVSTGIVFNHKLDLVHSAREAARYGSALPVLQCTPTANCGGKTWAQLVQSIAAQRSDGDVNSGQVCVALVKGASGTPIDSTFTTQSDGTGCFNDGNADTGARVQVRIVRANDSINAAFIKIPITLTTTASSKFEL